MSDKAQARRWSFTYNNPPMPGQEYSEYLEERKGVKWFVFQLEKAPTTGTLHFQGFIGFANPKRMNEVKKVLNCDHVHLEPMKAKKVDYAMKEDTRQEGPWQYGTPTFAGKRSDIAAFVDSIKAKATDVDLIDKHPDQWIKYQKTIEVTRAALSARRTEPPTVILFSGQPGDGKTRAAIEYATKRGLSFYIRTPHKTWFQGYQGQDVCILDEVDKYEDTGLPFGLFLRLIDRYPVDVEVKGGSWPLTSKVMILTAVNPPEAWYRKSDIREQIERRVTRWFDCQNGEWIDRTSELFRPIKKEPTVPPLVLLDD